MSKTQDNEETRDGYGKYGKLALGENDVIIKEGVIKFPEDENDRPALVGKKCTSCGDVSFPPRHFCPMCGGTGEEFHFGTFGEIITHTTVYQGGFGIKTPYAVGMIFFPDINDPELTVVAQIVDCDPADVAIGKKVELIIDRTRSTFVGGIMKMMGMPGEYVVGFKYRLVEGGKSNE